MISKRAAEHWFVSPFVVGLGHVVTDRKAGAAAYDDALAKLRAGEYVAILPEAGVSRSYTVRALKTGAVRLAAEAGVPVIPVSVWGLPPAADPRPRLRRPARLEVPRAASTSAPPSTMRPASTSPRRPGSSGGNSRTASRRASQTSR